MNFGCKNQPFKRNNETTSNLIIFEITECLKDVKLAKVILFLTLSKCSITFISLFIGR